MPNDVFEFQTRAAAGGAGGEPLVRARARLVRFTGRERVSRPYRYDCVFLIERTGEDIATALLSTRATLSMHLGGRGGETRRVHGVIDRVSIRGRAQDGKIELGAQLVPEMAVLRRTRRSRVFQGASAPEVAKQVLEKAGIDVASRLTGAYTKRDLCIQYMESDLDFVERILAEEGVFYFFDEADSGERERVVLADDANRSGLFGRPPEGVFRAIEGLTERPNEVADFRAVTRTEATRVRLKEFDFERPSFALGAAAEATDGDVRLEVYEHHGEHGGLDVQPSAATRRLEQARRRARIARGSSRIFDLSAGYTFALGGAPQPELDGTYTVLEVVHRGSVPELDAETGAVERRVYENRFTCVPRAIVARPRARPRRLHETLLTATVVGPRGQEIHTDAFGRVRIQFHWDREGARNETSSCWVRVAQTWAGTGWGFQFIPRIGMEVLVAFVGGDLDRPLVVSAVPNAEHPVPFALPQFKSKSGIRTESTRGGGGFHEISFEDRKGYERLYVHAERDYDEDVVRNKQHRIGGDLLLLVDGSSSREIGGEELSVVRGSRVTAIAEDETLDVGGLLQLKIDGAHRVQVAKDATLVVGGSLTSRVDGAQSTEVRGNVQTVYDGVAHEVVRGLREVEARGGEMTSVFGDAQRIVLGAANLSANSLTATVGAMKERVYLDVTKHGDVHLDAAGELVVRAGKSITLAVGKTTFVLDEDGIRMDGKNVSTTGGHIEVATDDASLVMESKIEGKAQAVLFSADAGGLVALNANAQMNGAQIKLGSGDSASSAKREERKAEEPDAPKVKVVLYDLRGAVCAGATYEASVPGWTKTGTAADGSVELPLFRDVESAKVRWGRPKEKREEGAPEETFEFEKTVFLRTDAPKTEEKLRRQLSNLGHGHADLEVAIAAFEAHKGLDRGALPQLGDLDKTVSAVADQHGKAEPARKEGAA